MPIYSANTVIEAIGDYHNDLVGRDATDAEVALYLARYRTNPDLGAIRTAIARTPDARDALASVFSTTVGTAPDAARLDQLQQALVEGATLDDIEATLAPEVPNDPDTPDDNGALPDDTPGRPDAPELDNRREAVDALYQNVLGRDADLAGLDFWERSPAPLSAVRQGLAKSDEARTALNGLYEAVLDRDGDAGGLVFWQSALAGGASLDGVRAALTGTAEARDALNELYEAVLSRDGDTAGLDFWQGRLADGAGLDDIRAALAGTDEARNAVADLYAAVLDRGADAAGLAFWQGQLAGAAALDGVRQSLAESGEVANILSGRYVAATGVQPGDDVLAAYVARLSAGGATLDALENEIEALAPAGGGIVLEPDNLAVGTPLFYHGAVFQMSTVAVPLLVLSNAASFGTNPAPSMLPGTPSAQTDPVSLPTVMAASITIAGLYQPGPTDFLLSGTP